MADEVFNKEMLSVLADINTTVNRVDSVVHSALHPHNPETGAVGKIAGQMHHTAKIMTEVKGSVDNIRDTVHDISDDVSDIKARLEKLAEQYAELAATVRELQQPTLPYGLFPQPFPQPEPYQRPTRSQKHDRKRSPEARSRKSPRDRKKRYYERDD